MSFEIQNQNQDQPLDLGEKNPEIALKNKLGVSQDTISSGNEFIDEGIEKMKILVENNELALQMFCESDKNHLVGVIKKDNLKSRV